MYAKNRVDKHLLVAAFALVIAIMLPEAQAAGVMDTISDAAQSGAAGWMNKALDYARGLFFGLAALEFIWSAVQLTLQKSELSEMAVGLLMKVITISFFGMILTFAPQWIGAIQDSFKQAAGGIGGVDIASLTPSGLFDKGLDVAARMLNSVPDSGWDIPQALLFAVIAGLSAIFIIIGYLIIAFQLMITMVEMYLALSAGALMLGFLGSRWTMSFGERYFGYAVSIGVKLLTIYLVAAFGDNVTTAIINNMTALAASSDGLSPTDMLGLGGTALMFGASGYMVPGLAGSLLNGSPSMSMSNMGQAAKGIASMPAKAGFAWASMAAGGLGTAAALASKFAGGGSVGSISGSPPGGGGGGGGISGFLNGRVGTQPQGQGGRGGANGQNPARHQQPQGQPPQPQMQHQQAMQQASHTPQQSSAGGGQQGSGAGQSAQASQPAQQQGGYQNNSYQASQPAQQQPQQAAGGYQSGGVAMQQQSAGFQSPRSMQQPAQQQGGYQNNSYQASQPAQQQPTQQNKLDKFSASMSKFAKRMQYNADRTQTQMGHDGHTGGAPNIKLDI